MVKSLKNDTQGLCDFLKGHKEVNDVTLTKEEQTLILKVNAPLTNSVNWPLLQDMAQHYFNLTHNHNVQIDYPQPPRSKQTVFLGDEDLVVMEKPKPAPTPTQPIVAYSTEKMDWKLYRFFSQSGKSLESNYYTPQAEIAEKERGNLERTYCLIFNDMQNKTFTRNIIELNINCLNSNDFKDDYINTLRQLPIQLKNRIAISLVRISPNVSIHNLRQAALICKISTDNIFLSFPYLKILDKNKLSQIYGIAGYVITVERGTVSSFDDVKKVYDRLNMLLEGKRVFVIFSDNKDYGTSYKSSNIIRLSEKEKIGIDQ